MPLSNSCCFMSGCSAMPSWKVMYALMNKDMRSMWPVCRSSFYSQADKIPNCTIPIQMFSWSRDKPQQHGLCQTVFSEPKLSAPPLERTKPVFLNVSAHKYYTLILLTLNHKKAREWFFEWWRWPLVSVHFVYKIKVYRLETCLRQVIHPFVYKWWTITVQTFKS